MRILSTLLLLFVSVLAGCTSNYVSGSGNAATETREVSNFDTILLQDDGELILTQDGTETLVVEADDNILPLIETFVRGDTLVIKTRNNTSIRTKTPIRYTLSVKNIQELNVSSDGRVTTNSLEADKLQLTIKGNGRIEIDTVDATEQFAVDISGDGTIIVDAAKTGDASVNVTGNGRIEIDTVDATEQFSVDISGDGAIIVDAAKTGDASVNVTGNGNVEISSIAAQELKTTMSGDGQITIAGEVMEQLVDSTGNGRITANELRSSNAEINVSGDGRVSLWILETMDVTILGNGTISYFGSPKITQKISGDGRLVSAQ